MLSTRIHDGCRLPGPGSLQPSLRHSGKQRPGTPFLRGCLDAAMCSDNLRVAVPLAASPLGAQVGCRCCGGQRDGQVLVMELCATDLADALAAARARLDEALVKALMAQLLRGVRACHSAGDRHDPADPGRLSSGCQKRPAGAERSARPSRRLRERVPKKGLTGGWIPGARHRALGRVPPPRPEALQPAAGARRHPEGGRPRPRAPARRGCAPPH